MAEPEQQAQGPAHIAVDALERSIASLRMEMRAGRLGRQVTQFNGDGSRRYRDWLNDIERVGRAVNANDDTCRAMSLETLKGPALEQFSRLFRANPAITWEEIRQGLNAIYLDAADGYIAVQKLHRTKQRKGESIHSFTERIRSLAEEGYVGQDLTQQHVQDAMIEALIQGVYEPRIAKAVIRNRPNDFAGAIALANTEHTATKHFSVRRGDDHDEPMDVDAINNDRFAQLEHRLDSLTTQMQKSYEQTSAPRNTVLTTDEKLDFLMAKVASQDNEKILGNQKRGLENKQSVDRYRWTADGKLICAHCNMIGHVRRNCYKRKRLAINKGGMGN